MCIYVYVGTCVCLCVCGIVLLIIISRCGCIDMRKNSIGSLKGGSISNPAHQVVTVILDEVVTVILDDTSNATRSPFKVN